MDPFPQRPGLWLAATLAALALGASGARAATISGVSIVPNAANTANFFDNTGASRSVAQSAVSVLSSSATGFSARYAAVVGADDPGGAASFTQSFTANFTITFSVNAASGELWVVDVAIGRTGALTLVDDGSGAATATLGALSGTHGGAGSLAGSLGLAAVGTASNTAAPGTSPNVAFAQSGAALISGVGTGGAQLVTLTFSFTASAQTIDIPGGGPAGDEAALRMGLDSALGSFSADNYPGVGGRTLAGDGIVVGVSFVPEPETAALLWLGLGGLAVLGRDRRRRGSA